MAAGRPDPAQRELASQPHALAALWRGLAKGGQGRVLSRYLGLSHQREGPEGTGGGIQAPPLSVAPLGAPREGSTNSFPQSLRPP